MEADEVADYHLVKKAIRYDNSKETHRRKFRVRVRGKGESYSELATSLMDLVQHLDQHLITLYLLHLLHPTHLHPTDPNQGPGLQWPGLQESDLQEPSLQEPDLTGPSLQGADLQQPAPHITHTPLLPDSLLQFMMVGQMVRNSVLSKYQYMYKKRLQLQPCDSVEPMI